MFEAAVTRLIGRVDGTLAEVEAGADGRFPVHAEPDTGAWTWAGDGSWCGGFWGGSLWLAAAATGDDRQLTGREVPNGVSPASTWSRAQAWAVLGLAEAAHWSPDGQCLDRIPPPRPPRPPG